MTKAKIVYLTGEPFDAVDHARWRAWVEFKCRNWRLMEERDAKRRSRLPSGSAPASPAAVPITTSRGVQPDGRVERARALPLHLLVR